jgi:hypothetical protein
MGSVPGGTSAQAREEEEEPSVERKKRAGEEKGKIKKLTDGPTCQ